MIRVGIDARPLQYPNTGIGQYTFNIVSRLNQHCDFQIFLYSTKPLHNQFKDVRRRSPSINFLPNSLLAQMYFPTWAAKDNIHVFWSPRHHLPLMLKVPSVVTIHDLVWKKHPETMTRGGAMLERLLMPPSIRKADAIICVSAATMNDLRDLAPDAAEKCRVILEAACQVPEDLDYAPTPKPFYLFVGTQEPRKNLATCLRAWKQSQLADQGYEFIIAGGTGWKTNLPKEIDRLGLNQSVRCMTPDKDQIRELYSRCFAVVLPSIYEGFGLPLVEAMAFGKPLITSNVSSMPEVAGDAAVLVDPYSKADLADAFIRLAEDPHLYHTLAEAASRRATLFSWDTAALETGNLLRKVAESPTPRHC